MDSDELWDAASGKLRIELLASGEADEYRRCRSLLMRNKEGFYSDLVRIVAGNPSYVLTENGVVKAIKSQITSSRWVVYKDAITLHSTVKLAEFQRSMELKHPVFVMAFIISPSPSNLPLGMFLIESHNEDKKTWQLQRCADVATWLPVPSAMPQEETLAEASETDAGNALPEASSTISPPLPGPNQNESRRAVRGCSLRFSHNSDEFDSLLECIHREAFRRMGLKYLVTRNAFQLGHLLTEQSQKRYTTDGILYASVGAPSSPLQVFHVEIKPGPLSVDEGERCKALCQFLNQNVLCISGGNISDAQFAEESTQQTTAVDYAMRMRHRFCIDMSVYLAQGVDIPPLYCPSVMWHLAEGGPWSTPFLSAFHAANPRQWEETRLRLLRIYHLATKDAARFARGVEPY